jgi:type II secretory pathway component GspD/PulD (secretin)
VLSAPSLVVLNNKAASINVGTQIPVEQQLHQHRHRYGRHRSGQSFAPA